MHDVRWNQIEVILAHGEQYTDLTRSLVFPDLDVSLLARLADSEDQTQALLTFRDGLRP
jgi:hypothetical protein